MYSPLNRLIFQIYFRVRDLPREPDPSLGITGLDDKVELHYCIGTCI